MITRITDQLTGQPFTDIDLHLELFGLPTVSNKEDWWGESREYLISMLKDGDDEALASLDNYLFNHDPATAAELIWRDGSFHLFISHMSAHKDIAKALADELAAYGVHGFVAHEDIQPNSAWERTIADCLGTCDALVALMHPGFNLSPWTDQEVGWVLGRPRPVLSVRLGMNPYGFAGGQQAIAGGTKSAEVLAIEIVAILANDVKTASQVREVLVHRLTTSVSFSMSNKIIRNFLIRDVELTDDEVNRVRWAAPTNWDVGNANALQQFESRYAHVTRTSPPPPKTIELG
jgi:TIR domain